MPRKERSMNHERRLHGAVMARRPSQARPKQGEENGLLDVSEAVRQSDEAESEGHAGKALGAIWTWGFHGKRSGV